MRPLATPFASNADGTLTVIHQDAPDQYHVIETVQTAQAARNMGSIPPITGYSRLGRVWTGAGGWQGQGSRVAGNVHIDGDRARSDDALTVQVRGSRRSQTRHAGIVRAPRVGSVRVHA